MTNVSSTVAAARRPAKDNVVSTVYRACTSSPETVYAGEVVSAMIRYCGPRFKLRRRWFPENPFLIPCSIRVQSGANGTVSPRRETSASM